MADPRGITSQKFNESGKLNYSKHAKICSKLLIKTLDIYIYNAEVNVFIKSYSDVFSANFEHV